MEEVPVDVSSLIHARTAHLVGPLNAAMMTGGSVLTPPPLPNYVTIPVRARLFQCTPLIDWSHSK
jgi:hypothetical protein